MDLTTIIGKAVLDQMQAPATTTAPPTDICIIRTYSAGVFYGRVAAREGREATLANSRRVWRWKGASELTDLAVNGPRDPGECRISPPVAWRIVTEVIEIIPCTPAAAAVIDGVAPWTS
jgi:hypothetical protein